MIVIVIGRQIVRATKVIVIVIGLANRDSHQSNSDIYWADRQ